MSREQDDNRELAELLRQFALPHHRDVESAHREFYRRVGPALGRQVLRGCGYNEELAKVALQETWLKVLRAAASYDPARSPVRAWVALLASQCVVDEMRKQYRHERWRGTSHAAGPDDDSGHDGDAASDAPGSGHGADNDPAADLALSCPLFNAPQQPDDAAHQSQWRQAALACLDSLSTRRHGARLRMAMELALAEDKTYAEMVDELQVHATGGQPIHDETVRGWVRTARDYLRGCLARKLRLENRA